MNRENLLHVADAIENHKIQDLGFNMSTWNDVTADWAIDHSGHSCGTVACIGGTAAVLMSARNPRNQWNSEAKAANWLGLSSRERHLLFFGKPTGVEFLCDVQAKHAVATCRYAAEHNVIDWDKAQTWAAEQKERA